MKFRKANKNTPNVLALDVDGNKVYISASRFIGEGEVSIKMASTKPTFVYLNPEVIEFTE
jgi:hypothetical protein